MSAWIRSVTGRAYHFQNGEHECWVNGVMARLQMDDTLLLHHCIFLVPIAQSKEREYPKLQVAGESPAGDTIAKPQTPNSKLQRTLKLQIPSALGDPGAT